MSSNITSLTHHTYAGNQDEEAEALITEEDNTFEEQKNQNSIQANLFGERA